MQSEATTIVETTVAVNGEELWGSPSAEIPFDFILSGKVLLTCSLPRSKDDLAQLQWNWKTRLLGSDVLADVQFGVLDG